MTKYFYIQNQQTKLVATIDGFQLGGKLKLYPAYGGANQLWNWGINNSLVSKMGLVAAFDKNSWVCIAVLPANASSWQYTNDLLKTGVGDERVCVMTVSHGADVASEIFLYDAGADPYQHWILMPEEELAH